MSTRGSYCSFVGVLDRLAVHGNTDTTKRRRQVSGESGAGKTESVKIMMSFIAGAARLAMQPGQAHPHCADFLFVFDCQLADQGLKPCSFSVAFSVHKMVAQVDFMYISPKLFDQLTLRLDTLGMLLCTNARIVSCRTQTFTARSYRGCEPKRHRYRGVHAYGPGDRGASLGLDALRPHITSPAESEDCLSHDVL